MIAENASDLLNKIATVSALATSHGLTVGGGKIDPSETKIPLPSAWVLFAAEKEQDQELGMVLKTQTINGNYIVLIDVPFISQSDLISNQFPLLDAVRASIHGTNTPRGFRWKFDGQRLLLINPDRMRYEQTYSAIDSK